MTYPSSIDLSLAEGVNLDRATKLEHVAFMCLLRPGWILATLETVTRDHRELKRIALAVFSSRGFHDSEGDEHAVGGGVYQKWLELDRLLVQLRESHSIRLEVTHDKAIDTNGRKERSRMKVLLPEVMAREMVDLAGQWR